MVDLPPDELIETLVDNPAEPPSVVGLDGYLGRSAMDGHVRLYRDLSVSYWLDIPADKVRLTRTVDVAGKFHRMSVVWVETDARVFPGSTDRRSLIQELLQGDFTAGGLTEVEVPEELDPEVTGLWPNNLRGTIRHLKRPWTACK